KSSGCPDPIPGMVDPVFHGHVRDGEWIDALQAADVEAVLFRVGPALVMGMDAAVAAEVMLRRAGVELVEPEMFGPLDDAQPRQRDRRDHGALAAADGAVAASGIHDAVLQVQFQFDGATVARGAMPGLDCDAANFLEHRGSSFGTLKFESTQPARLPRLERAVGSRTGWHRISHSSEP